MSSNRLKLNAGKTEFTWLGTRQQLAKLNMLPLQINNQVITPLDKVRDPGIIIDSKLTMDAHTIQLGLERYQKDTQYRIPNSIGFDDTDTDTQYQK